LPLYRVGDKINIMYIVSNISDLRRRAENIAIGGNAENAGFACRNVGELIKTRYTGNGFARFATSGVSLSNDNPN
jgi:hypothetical protein